MRPRSMFIATALLLCGAATHARPPERAPTSWTWSGDQLLTRPELGFDDARWKPPQHELALDALAAGLLERPRDQVLLTIVGPGHPDPAKAGRRHEERAKKLREALAARGVGGARSVSVVWRHEEGRTWVRASIDSPLAKSDTLSLLNGALAETYGGHAPDPADVPECAHIDGDKGVVAITAPTDAEAAPAVRAAQLIERIARCGGFESATVVRFGGGELDVKLRFKRAKSVARVELVASRAKGVTLFVER